MGMTPRVPGWTDKQLEEFVEAVKLLRERLDPAYLRKKLGVSRQTLVSWQTGECAPSAENRQAVLDLARAARKLPD